jgi:hypothetical protein
MGPQLRKLALTAHVVSSVGWMGAVGGFLALAIAGLQSGQDQVMRAAYLSMELTGWFVIVPLSFASLLTGIVQSLGTPWGLFRHYWVVVKLVMASLATAVLLLHMQPIGHMAHLATQPSPLGPELRGLRIQLLVDAAAALMVLLVATVLSVYKPRGLTRYGRRKRREERQAAQA